ncbi:hypothetical protein ACM55F_06955 [Flavobacterium sp. XS2P12]|uniref:hypothetical protein n=1 Tax=Flavobacterium melibiosi TaxID=3398734 RepID=UPI003A8B58FF
MKTQKTFLAFTFLITSLSFGQTNTFPPTGNAGIGTTNPNSTLQIGDSNNSGSPSTEVEIKRLSLAPVTHSGSDWFFTTRDNNPYANLDIGYSDNKTLTIRHDGNVGIGTTTPQAKLQVEGLIKSYVPDVLGGNLNNFQLLDERAGNVTSNRIYNRLWTLRDGGPNNWLGARLHYGISVDVSFATPHVDTRTWWERDPYDNIQSWGNAGDTYLTINKGKVGIGSTNPDQKLTVKGKIHAEEIIVDLAVPADYVFQKYYTGKSELKSDYTLPTLAEIESFTKKNHHLPNVPSAQEVQQNGVSLGTMSNVLLQKVEELTLYAIEQNKVIEELKAQVTALMAKKQ